MLVQGPKCFILRVCWDTTNSHDNFLDFRVFSWTSQDSVLVGLLGAAQRWQSHDVTDLIVASCGLP